MARRMILPLLAAALALSLLFQAAAEDAEIIGVVPSLCASNTGNGSLSDQSDLGAAAADAAVYVTGADAAILCGGDLAGNLKPGPATMEDIRFVFANDPQLVTAQLTGAELIALLEFCLSGVEVDTVTKSIDREASAFAAFPQIGGLELRYDASAPAGERVLDLKLMSGGEERPVEPEESYTVAAPLPLLAGDYGDIGIEADCRPAGLSLSEALARFLAEGAMGPYVRVKRISVVGVTDAHLVRQFGMLPVVLCSAIIILGVSALRGLRGRNRQ